MPIENEYLFIGGTQDGKVHTMFDRLTVRFSFPMANVFGKPPESDNYRMEMIRGREKAFAVFVHESLSPDDLMAKLIDGYKQP